MLPRLPRLKALNLMVFRFTPTGEQALQQAWRRARKPGVDYLRLRGLFFDSDAIFLFASIAWEVIPVLRMRKEVQAARAWPLDTDEAVVEIAGEGRTEAVEALVRNSCCCCCCCC